MKRFSTKVATFVAILCITTLTAFAVGNVNVGSSGGSINTAPTTYAYWSSGRDGVRVSVVEIASGSVLATGDFTTNGSYVDGYASIIYHFQKTSKLAYNHGASLNTEQGSYSYFELPSMPAIVNGSGANNLDAIKTFFALSGTVQEISSVLGIPFDTVTNGDYALLLEPIGYFVYAYNVYAATATEVALLDVTTSNDLRYWLRSFSHTNLPLSMFLTDGLLGISPFPDPTTSSEQSNSTILTYLGCGTVTFEPPATATSGIPTNYIFRTDTDVIVSIELTNTSSVNITPDTNAYVDINIDGTTYRKQFVCPSRETQTVWVQWHTPDTPQIVDIRVTSSQVPTLNNTFTATIEEIEETPPPDPGYYDSNSSYRLPPLRTWTDVDNTRTDWSEWTCYWEHDPTTHYLLGLPWTCSALTCDRPTEHGHWEFDEETYSASLTVSDFSISPDSNVPTANLVGSRWTMPSGYGINVDCTVAVTYSTGVNSYDVTPVQYIVTLYPEFEFSTYNRFMMNTTTSSTALRRTWTLQENPYSFYSEPNHFTPLWYPDNVEYQVQGVIFDAWTPGGMLSTTVDDSMLIYRSAIDDWYIHIT